MLISRTHRREDIDELINSGYVGLYLSQSCEDNLLWKLFSRKRGGYYVDVGAHHPIRYSNTYLLSKFAGWRGLNIDADQRAIDLFDRMRPNDRNCLAAISDEPGVELKFTIYTDGAVNTFDDGMRRRREDRKSVVEREIVMKTKTLASILEDYLPSGQEIDFMDVDVEGFDLRVLCSNDWTRFRPHYVFVEMHGFDLSKMLESEVVNYMIGIGYKMKFFTFVTGVFQDCNV